MCCIIRWRSHHPHSLDGPPTKCELPHIAGTLFLGIILRPTPMAHAELPERSDITNGQQENQLGLCIGADQGSEGIVLYGLYDMQHAALYPARVLAEATQNVFQNPFMPASYMCLGRTIAAGAELFERTTRRFGKPAFSLSVTTINGDDVAVREISVLSKPFCTLVHFERATDEVHPT